MNHSKTHSLPLSRLLNQVRLEHQDIARLGGLTFGIGLLNLATPVAVQALVNIVTMGGLLEPLFVVSLMLFLILCLSGALYLLERYIVELIQRRIFVRVAVEASESAKSAKLELHDAQNTVELMNRFFDVITVQKSGAVLLTSGLSALLQALVGSIVLLFYSLYFGIVVAVILFLLFITVRVIGAHAEETAIYESKSKYEIAAWIETLARNVATFKFSGGYGLGSHKTDELAHRYLDKRQKHFSTLFSQNLVAMFLYATAGTAMLALGGALVIKGQINLGQFVAAELIIFGVLASYRKCIEQLEYYYDLIAAFDKLGVLEDIPSEKIDGYELNDSSLHLKVSQLSFEFTPKNILFSGVSFELQPNEHLAIVGESGSGKSTLAELITGLRLPTQGSVEYNLFDIRQLNLQILRSRIGYASSIEIIEEDIIENIRLGRNEIAIDAINSVLNDLDLLDEIAKLDDGLTTTLTHTGAPLSSIQSQLLIIARAAIGKPSLLIIDGLLDGLDEASLEHVIDYLNDPKHKWSLLIFTRIPEIANRFERKLTITKEGLV